MKKLLCTAVTGLMLVGCATQRPELPEAYYLQNSGYWATFTRCHEQGMLNTELTAIASSEFRRIMSGYSVDTERFNREAKEAYHKYSAPSQNVCSQIAVNMTEKKQQREMNIHSAARDPQSNNNYQIKQTYCNKIGNQTLCSSY